MPAKEMFMERQVTTWDRLCMLAAVETDPEKLQGILAALELALVSRQEELLRRQRRVESADH